MARGLSGVTATNRVTGSHGFVHVGVILVGHDAGERCDVPPGQVIPDILGQGFQALGIVTTVYNYIGVSPQQLKPPGPYHIPETVPNILFRNAPATADQAVHRCQHHGGIAQLMGPQEGDFQGFPGTKVEHLPRKAV